MAPPPPAPRGPLTSALLARLSDGDPLHRPDVDDLDPLVDDDVQLALWCCYALHYRGFDGVDDSLEWDPQVLAFRAGLEAAFEAALRTEHRGDDLPRDPAAALSAITGWEGPSLSATVATSGTRSQLQEFAIHRSAYQLKEADPHTFAIPRLHGPGRSAMLEIQLDEYGHGRPGEAHAEIFAAAMDQLGLDSRFGHYIDRLPGTTLATDNLASMFGLHRRLRGALVGHLALFEMTSVAPMSRYLGAAQRVGDLPALERFYEIHVEADTRHGQLALDQMVTGVIATEPELADDVIFGAAALTRVEQRFAQHLLASWQADRSSLRPALDEVLASAAA
jgi:hypothetical protein